MLDMDNVITDGNILSIIEEFYQKKIDYENMEDYHLVQALTNDNKEEFWSYMKQKDFYENASLLKDCYEVLEKLNSLYDIYVVTSYLWKETEDLSGKCLQDKYYYLRKQLPFIPPEKYIFTTDKTMIHFDIAIDDKKENLSNADQKILFSAWHNKKVEDPTITRVNNWKEIENLLTQPQV